MPSDNLERVFPNLLQDGYQITSPEDYQYNCIAYAADDNRNWWQPSEQGGTYWTHDDSRLTLENYIQAYATLDYEPCDTEELEEGYEKVALYVDAFGIPSHAAKQKESGVWTSKLGELEDIEHNTLNAFDGSDYGRVAQILRRARKKTGGTNEQRQPDGERGIQELQGTNQESNVSS
jgi:hypothetical protein